VTEPERQDDAPEGAPPQGDASEKQLNFIRVLQRKVGISDDDMADILQDVAGKATLEALDRPEASEVIDELQIQAKDKGVDLDAQPAASDKQVGFMKSLKRRAHLTDDEFAKFLDEHAGTTQVEKVGKRDASKVIDALLAIVDGKKGKSEAPGEPAPPPADDDVPF
jgi:hypothetical protein